MEWIQSLTTAIDYIEDNLLNEQLTVDEIASNIYFSSFHFQRVFSILTGMSVGDYIRNRRLSLAGSELSHAKLRIIDIAYKYGYDTPESFSKAFKRFHGITPIEAVKGGAQLKSFGRLVIKMKLEGGQIMDYRIEKMNSFYVLADVRKFNDHDSFKTVPQFWGEYFKQGKQKIVCGEFGLCIGTTNNNQFDYGIGARADKDAKVPNGFVKLEIPSYTWAIFKCVGPMPDAIQNMWKRIYTEFLPGSGYEMIPDYNIEYYPSDKTADKDYVSEIWIPVKEKSK